MFGLLPQINTFIMYFMEQIDVHIFGGTCKGFLEIFNLDKLLCLSLFKFYKNVNLWFLFYGFPM